MHRRQWEFFWLTAEQSAALQVFTDKKPHTSAGETKQLAMAVHRAFHAKILALFHDNVASHDAWRCGEPRHIVIRGEKIKEWQVWDYRHFHQRHIVERADQASIVSERWLQPMDCHHGNHRCSKACHWWHPPSVLVG